MRERIAGLIGEEAAREATIGTFHAICARILRRDGNAIGLTRSFTIYDRADQVALVKGILRRLDLDEKRFSPAGMLAWIGQRKDELADVATATRQAANYYDETAAPRLRRVPAPARRGRRGRLRRPADARRLPVRAASRDAGPLPGPLAADPGRRVPGHEPRAVPALPRCWPPSTATWRWSATTTRASTRGAARTCATSSTSSATTPIAKVVKLEQNYRSTQTILDAAHAVVSRNEGRKDKKLWTDRGGRHRRSPCSTPTTSTRRPSSSRARSRSWSAAPARGSRRAAHQPGR